VGRPSEAMEGSMILDTGALLAVPVSVISEGFALEGQRKELERLAPDRVEMVDVFVNWADPSEKSLSAATEIARESGDLAGLSSIDLGLFALAIELGFPLLTDDYRLQNLCGISGLEWLGIDADGIRGIWSWEVSCVACDNSQEQPSGTFSKRGDMGVCPHCGSPLKLRRVRV